MRLPADYNTEQRRALRSPRARKLLTCVEERPGLCVTDLRKAIDAGSSSTRHHLKKRLAVKLVRTATIGRRSCFFPATAMPQDTALRVAALVQGVSRRTVAEALVQKGETTVRALVAETGLSDRSVYHHIQKLVAAGLAARRGSTLAATPALVRALREHRT